MRKMIGDLKHQEITEKMYKMNKETWECYW